MNILFVVPYAPNKIRIRPYNLMRFLSARGNQVTLLTLQTDHLDADFVRQLVAEGYQVFAFSLPTWRSMMNAARGVLTGRSAPIILLLAATAGPKAGRTCIWQRDKYSI